MSYDCCFQANEDKIVLDAKDMLDDGTPIVLKVTINEEDVSTVHCAGCVRTVLMTVLHCHAKLHVFQI